LKGLEPTSGQHDRYEHKWSDGYKQKKQAGRSFKGGQTVAFPSKTGFNFHFSRDREE